LLHLNVDVVSLIQALIAGGTFNGDLYVWDLSQEGDPQRGRSDVLCEVRHQVGVVGYKYGTPTGYIFW
jgi:hypothetical protein